MAEQRHSKRLVIPESLVIEAALVLIEHIRKGGRVAARRRAQIEEIARHNTKVAKALEVALTDKKGAATKRSTQRKSKRT